MEDLAVCLGQWLALPGENVTGRRFADLDAVPAAAGPLTVDEQFGP